MVEKLDYAGARDGLKKAREELTEAQRILRRLRWNLLAFRLRLHPHRYHYHPNDDSFGYMPVLMAFVVIGAAVSLTPHSFWMWIGAAIGNLLK